MTPDEARALLDGTTPGPWEVDTESTVEASIWSSSVIVVGPYYDREDAERWETGTPEDLRLAAAAPALAVMVAGMREEWGVTCEVMAGPTTFKHAEWVDSDGHPLSHHTAWLLARGKERAGYENVRIIRRYVTEPKEDQ